MFRDEEDSVSEETSTIYTASDALACKVSAVSAGYCRDPLVERMFNHIKRPYMSAKKSPIINRGYYSRINGIQHYLKKFEAACPGKIQLVNLGCGFDTLSLNISHDLGARIDIFEVDYESVVKKKVFIIQRDKALRDSIFGNHVSPDIAASTATADGVEHLPTLFERSPLKNHENAHELEPSGSLKLGNISFVGADLKHSEIVLSKLIEAGLNPDLPTFVLSECVLVYIHKTPVESLLRSLGGYLKQSMWVSYDMTNPNDAFGAMMLKNLTEAGFHIPGLTDYPTFESLRERFLQNSWESCNVTSMLTIFRKLITKEEMSRIMKLEIFDEVEEWNILMNHYGLCVALNGLNIEFL